MISEKLLIRKCLLLICNAMLVLPSNVLSSEDDYTLGRDEKNEGNLIFPEIISLNTEVLENLILRYCEFLYRYTFRRMATR